MPTKQPAQFCIANLGDNSPLDHGGAFLLVDRRGIYAPMMWVWEPEEMKLYRFDIPKCIPVFGDCDSVTDNPYHPDRPVWFGHEEKLRSVASTCGMYTHNLRDALTNHDPRERAHAYLNVANHFGLHEFDHYPDTMTRGEAKELIQRLCAQIVVADQWKDGLDTNPLLTEA